MEKRALCAFDTKRFLLDNGADTLAYGHKAITHDIAHEEIENPGRDIIMSAKQARNSGLVWSRRRGALKRLGYNPDDNGEETEEEALEAGKAMRERMRKRVTGLKELPDILIPQELRPLQRREPETAASTISKKRSRLRIDSDDDCEIQLIPNPDKQTEVA